MRRRDFIKFIAGSAAAWPLSARTQQPSMPVIGFLHSASPAPIVKLMVAFRKGLFDVGFVEGQNAAIEYRWAEDQNDRLPALAADLVRRRVAVIATPGSTPAALAAKAATATIPVVFATGGDPVALGLVTSVNRPGGNVTGISFEATDVWAKALELMHEVVPQASHIVAIVNPNSALTEPFLKNLQGGAATLRLQVDTVNINTDSEIEMAFANISQRPGSALLISGDPFFTSRRAEIVASTARHALPTMYIVREFADAGGLISYGPDLTNAYREAGTYTGRILKGEKPADIPVLLPTKFQLVINLKTAKALGITIPDKLLALADDVIE